MASPPTPSIVQQADAPLDLWAGSNTATITLAAAPTSGNVIVLAIALGNGTSQSIDTPSGGGVATWTAAAQVATTTGAVSIYYGTTDGSSSTISVGYYNTGSLGNGFALAYELANVAEFGGAQTVGGGRARTTRLSPSRVSLLMPARSMCRLQPATLRPGRRCRRRSSPIKRVRRVPSPTS